MLMPIFSPGLRYFEHVARFGSIQEAARRLNVAASAVNRQVLKLEDEMGTALFERLPRGMRLTVAGQALVVEARRWLADAERLRGAIESMKGLRSGHVRIATIECLADDFLCQTIARFRKEHPAVSFDLAVGGTDYCLERMSAGQSDLVIVFNPPATAAHYTIWTMDWPIGAIIRPDHPLGAASRVRIADCAPYMIVLPSGDLTLRKRLDPLVRRMGERGPPLLVSNSVASIKGIVRHSDAIGFLTAIDILTEARAGALKFIPLDDRTTPRDTLTMLINRSSGAAPAIDRFAHDVLDALDGLGKTP